MKKLIASLVLAAALVSSGCASLPVSTSTEYAITDAEWNFLCTEVQAQGYEQVDCSQITRPTVVVSKVVTDMTGDWEILYGFTYPGEDYIFVNPTTDAETQRTTIVHETVHYVLHQTYGFAVGRCESEHVARQVHHRWDGTPYDDSWRGGYQCTVRTSHGGY